MSSKKNTNSNLIAAIRDFFQERFDLDDDRANDFETIEYIKKGVEFKGTNLWILMFAIMVASVGLNLNSTAVIIGAMLISPLMGPIMGVGLGMGINDFALILKSLQNLAIAVVISILVSALYFYLSPLQDAQSELLSRTKPAIWDVLIGFFGGLAGIVAGSRQEKSNAIPGVAIATALMPPLCTAGYAMATFQWDFFFGAFYLFIINSVFISIATWLIVRYLKYPKKEFLDEKRERKAKMYILGFTLLTVIPSIFTALSIVRENIFETRANTFIDAEFNFSNPRILSEKMSYDSNSIEIFLFGKELSQEIIKQIESKMEFHNLIGTDLIIHQNESGSKPEDYLLQIEEVTQKYTSGIIEEIYEKNEQALASKSQQIALLEKEILALSSINYPVNDILKEVKAIDDNINALSISQAIQISADSTASQDTVCIALIDFTRDPKQNEVTLLENFLKTRTKSTKLKIVYSNR